MKTLNLTVKQYTKTGKIGFMVSQTVETEKSLHTELFAEHFANVLFQIHESQGRIKESVGKTRFFKLSKGNNIVLTANLDGINLLEGKMSIAIMSKIAIGDLSKMQFAELLNEFLHVTVNVPEL